MKTLVVWLGAFWFAISNHLAHLHPEKIFFSYEKDEAIIRSVSTTRMHPYFFPGVRLPENVHCVDDILSILKEVNIIIIIIPIPFVAGFIDSIAWYIQPGTVFVNCSKGIDNMDLFTVSDILSSKLAHIPYSYATLSGGMIASELVSGAPLGTSIGISDMKDESTLRTLFESDRLSVSITPEYKNIELFGAIKNVFALYVGYMEGKWFGMSTIGLVVTSLYKELPGLLFLLGWTERIDFSDFALWGDLIATCFGNSRNRYFGRLVWEGKTSIEAFGQLKSEKKHAEGYETLRGISDLIKENNFVEFQKVVEVFFPESMKNS